MTRWFLAATAVLLSPLAAAAGDVTPGRVAAALPELDRLAEQLLKRTGVPGAAVAVVYKDRVVHLKGYGVRVAGAADAVNSDTVFQLASVSKPLAATVLAAAVGDGVVGWDDRVTDHDPGFRLADPLATRDLTLRDLLCHRSGLPDHAGDLLEDLGYGRDEVLRRLRFARPGGGFRSHYAYTNFGFTEAGVVAARAAGTTWEDLAAAKLFRPLGMTATSYRFADYAAAPNRARLHVRDGDKWVAKHTRQPDAQAPAGGASSTARDLARWVRLLLAGGRFDGKQVIPAAALAETHRPQIATRQPADPAAEPAGFYGLGWTVNYDGGRVRLGHSGAFALGAATAVGLLPGDGLGVVVLTNGMPVGVPESLVLGFFDLALDGKAGKDWLAVMRPVFETLLKPPYTTDYSTPPAARSPALAPAAYAGTYTSDYYGTLEVAAGGGGLVARLGPKKAAYPLTHYDRDVFTYQPPGENAGGPSGMTFLVGAGGTAGRVVVENLDLDGQGTFLRQPSPR